MKELETHLHTGVNNANRVELNVKKRQEIEYVLEGTIKPKKGHFVWELNEETGEIKKAEYKTVTATFNMLSEKPAHKLIVNENCVYIPALNKENAKAKYLRNKEQKHYYSKPALLKLSDITF